MRLVNIEEQAGASVTGGNTRRVCVQELQARYPRSSYAIPGLREEANTIHDRTVSVDASAGGNSATSS
jgi:hypothetical protein